VGPRLATLYFHPWELDPDQAQLPLKPLNRFRTYVGTSRSRVRFQLLLEKYSYVRAVDVARSLLDADVALPRSSVADSSS